MNIKGNYEMKFENWSLVLGRGEGGVFGDPYDNISIVNGELHVKDFGGSSSRWSHNYIFKYKVKRQILNRIEVIYYSTHTLNGIINIYNLEDKSMVTKTICDDSTRVDNTKYINILIYSGKINSDTDIEFKDVYIGCELDFNVKPSYPMPNLGFYQYGQDFSGAKYSAEEILNKVQLKYHPKMKKVDILCDKKILDNYSFVIGYEVPSYYYSDGEYILSYFCMELMGDDNRIEHTVYYEAVNTKSSNDYDFYRYRDETGEEETY